MKKVIPLIDVFDIYPYLSDLDKTAVVLVRTRDEVSLISSQLVELGCSVKKLHEVGFSADGDVHIYVTTPDDFVTHYYMSMLRYRAPVCLSEIAVLAVDLDEYLLTDALKSKVLPLPGMVNGLHDNTTKTLLSATLKVLTESAQSNEPFYRNYTFDKALGVKFGVNFYNECQKAWCALNPTNENFKDNEGYYMFMSIVMNFVEALHTAHPTTHYTITSDGKLLWNNGASTMPFPLQQIIQSRHGLGLTSVEPITVQASLFMMLKEAGSFVCFSASPEFFTRQFQNIYGLDSVCAFEDVVSKDIGVSYFVSSSIMESALISRASKSSHPIIVYIGDLNREEMAHNANVHFISSDSSLSQIKELTASSSVELIFWDTPKTDIEQCAVIRKVSMAYKCQSIERHLAPNNSAFSLLEGHKVNAYLMASQSEFNIIARWYSTRKLQDMVSTFQYDNRERCVNLWLQSSELQSTLHYHYDKKRSAIRRLYEMSDESLARVISKSAGEVDSVALRKQMHYRLLSELAASSICRTVLSVVEPLNQSLARNIWEPNSIMKKSLQ